MTPNFMSASRGGKESKGRASSLRTPSRKLVVSFLLGFHHQNLVTQSCPHAVKSQNCPFYTGLSFAQPKCKISITIKGKRKAGWLIGDTYQILPLQSDILLQEPKIQYYLMFYSRDTKFFLVIGGLCGGSLTLKTS